MTIERALQYYLCIYFTVCMALSFETDFLLPFLELSIIYHQETILKVLKEACYLNPILLSELIHEVKAKHRSAMLVPSKRNYISYYFMQRDAFAV